MPVWGGIYISLKRLFVMVAGFLAACEAPLDLSRVDEEASRTIHRYDHFLTSAGEGMEVVLAGLGGVVLITSDSGLTWQRRDVAKDAGERMPSFIGGTRCPDGGHILLDYARRLWMLDDIDGVWQIAAIPTTEETIAVECDPAGRLWVVGSFSLILKSADNGLTWEDMSTGEDAYLTTVQFVDADTGFITGEFGTVLKTTDGGATWDYGELVADEFYSQTAYFADAENGYVAGLNGSIFHTKDGGYSWQRQDTGSSAPLYQFIERNGALLVAGNYGTLLRRNSDSWSAALSVPPSKGFLRASTFVGDGMLVVAGGGGVVLRIDIETGVVTPIDPATGGTAR